MSLIPAIWWLEWGKHLWLPRGAENASSQRFPNPPPLQVRRLGLLLNISQKWQMQGFRSPCLIGGEQEAVTYHHGLDHSAHWRNLALGTVRCVTMPRSTGWMPSLSLDAVLTPKTDSGFQDCKRPLSSQMMVTSFVNSQFPLRSDRSQQPHMVSIIWRLLRLRQFLLLAQVSRTSKWWG